MIKKLFLPVGMFLAIAITLYSDSIGLFISKNIGSSILIMLIFVISGMQSNFSELKINKQFFGALAIAGVVTLFIVPVLSKYILELLNFDMMITTGLLVIMAAPPALSSGIVMTVSAAGNMMLAIAITVVLNLLAILSMPVVITFLLDETASGGGILDMLWKLVKLVLIPFIIGAIIRKFYKKRHWSIDYLPLIATVMVVWSFIAGARSLLFSHSIMNYLFLLILCVVIHLLLLITLAYSGKLIKMDIASQKAMAFCGGSKTVSIALAMLAILGVENSIAVIPCLLYYLLQMLIDSILAIQVANKK